MTDIVTKLRSWVAYDKNGGYPGIRRDCLEDIVSAADEIERLRKALYEIAYDPVEMSQENALVMYHKHIVLARKTYDLSSPRKSAEYKPPSDVDDNF